MEPPRLLEEYLDPGSAEDCPYCGNARAAHYGGFECEGGQVWQKIRCGACNRCWNDIYRLTGVEDVDEEGEPITLYELSYIVIATQSGILELASVFTSRIEALKRGRELWKSITGYGSMAEQQERSAEDMHDLTLGYSPEWGGVARGYVMHWTSEEHDVWVTVGERAVTTKVAPHADTS